MIRRREIIMLAAGMTGLSLAARGQERMRRVAMFVGAGTPDDADLQARFIGFEQALEQLGWKHGHNVQIERRFAAGNPDAMRKHAAELAASTPDVIVAGGAAATAPMLQATHNIPVVFTNVVDPVGAGFVETMARPGGNATGFVSLEYGMSSKWLELIKEVSPRVSRVAVIRDPALSSGTGQFGAIQSAAPSLRLEVVPVNVRSPDVIERSIVEFAHNPNGGLVATASALTVVNRDLIVRLAIRHKLPSVFHRKLFVTAGGLMSYGPDIFDQLRRAAGYVDRILKGEKPADLPVQAPTKYELIINLKTAKTLGIAVPPSLLARADEVIE
jgi:putative ABC transport system substrate-binding protein